MPFDEFEEIFTLQAYLNKLTDDKIKSTVEYIKSLKYFFSKENSKFIANEIKSAALARYKNMDVYVKLIKELIAIFPEFEEIVFDNLVFLLSPEYAVNHFHSNVLLRKCVKAKIFDFKKVLNFINLLEDKNVRCHLSIFLSSFYLELKRLNPGILDRFTKYHDPHALVFYGMLSNAKARTESQVDCWNEYGVYPNSVEYFLFFDDVDSLIAVSTFPDFDIFTGAGYTQHSIYTQSIPDYNLLNMAAYFGSVKCFKYLFQKYPPNVNKSLFASACAGGNFEIIHLAEQRDKDYKSGVFYATKFRHLDVFKWIVDKNTRLNSRDLTNTLAMACTYNNLLVVADLSEWADAHDMSEFSDCPTWRSSLLHGHEIMTMCLCFAQKEILKYCFYQFSPAAKRIVKQHFKALKK